MIRKEAIGLVKSAFDAWEYNYDTGDDWSREHEARDMAIKALEQEPCGKDINVPATDVISRQAAIDAIWDGINMDIYTREVKECLEALPSVTPQQKVGR